MQTERITVRLQSSDIKAVDLMIKIGEFISRSDAIRVAVKELVESRTDKALDKVEKMKKMQKLAALADALEEYNLK